MKAHFTSEIASGCYGNIEGMNIMKTRRNVTLYAHLPT